MSSVDDDLLSGIFYLDLESCRKRNERKQQVSLIKSHLI